MGRQTYWDNSDRLTGKEAVISYGFRTQVDIPNAAGVQEQNLGSVTWAFKETNKSDENER